MTGTVLLTVPELVSAVYLVPSATAEVAPDELLRDRLPGDAGLVGALLDHGLLTVEVDPDGAAGLPFELLRVFGAEPDDVARLASAPHLLVVSAPGTPGWPPLHELGARSAARALAGPQGLVVDAATPRLLVGDDLAEPEDGSVPLVLTQLVVVPQSAGDRGHWLTTKGLGRFGLPELQALDVPPHLAPPWTALLSGLALTLIGRFDQALDDGRDGDGDAPAFVELDALVEVTARSVARAYGAGAEEADEAEGATVVQLEFAPSDPDHDEFLTVQAPDSFGRSAGEFHATAIEELFGREPAEIRRVQSDEDMDEAIATARSCLHVARERFLAGELGHETLLMVKYRLLTPDGGAEFPWFYVTSWADEGRIAGASASDVEADPSVRRGRPVSVATEDVADWGVWVDGRGMVEGGWTNALLEGEPPPPVPAGARPPARRRFGRRRKG